ncbi:MAG: DUF4392 domain-containing protein [Treponema sp.]|nr:DUF4392 domain-containing protein [Spirochaetales bacterium]MDY5810864.1 DUF4392 domain-containing protein [Treponema sp.]
MKNPTSESETIEEMVLRHSQRGMNILKEYMPENNAENAAKLILSWQKGTVFLATGFYVAGFAETDGPAGTVFLAKALKTLGYRPVIVTDKFCRDFFEGESIEVIYMDLNAGESWCKNLLEEYKPVGLISIERCGKNKQDDYANMRGISIAENTAKIDLLFELAYSKIPTIGVGDGGNEIGMGNVSEIISDKLELCPCVVPVSQLVIATVSNWGAYAITAYLQRLTGQKVFMDSDTVVRYIEKTVKLGSVDGVLKKQIVGVDGFPISVEKEIIDALGDAI